MRREEKQLTIAPTSSGSARKIMVKVDTIETREDALLALEHTDDLDSYLEDYDEEYVIRL